MNNQSESIIEEVTTKLREKGLLKLKQASYFGWIFEKPDQVEFDAIGRNAASDVLVEINVIDEAIADKRAQLQNMMDTMNYGLSQYHPLLNDKFDMPDLANHGEHDGEKKFKLNRP